MEQPSAQTLLDAWEKALSQAPAMRALTLLQAAMPEHPREALEALSVGRRNRILLELRATLFGNNISCVADCPACSERLELALATETFIAADPEASPTTLDVRWRGSELHIRVPTAGDLSSVSKLSHLAEASRRLLQGCFLDPQTEAARQAMERMDTELVDTIGRSLSEADPLANIELSLACVRCHHQWVSSFDVVQHLWTEVNAWANRIVAEVHIIASTYGWTESAILSMNPVKRQMYLNRIMG